jgi:hypothetical protein
VGPEKCQYRLRPDLLEDPHQRLIDEVFWLWGGSASGCGCVGTLHAEHDDAVRYPA